MNTPVVASIPTYIFGTVAPLEVLSLAADMTEILNVQKNRTQILIDFMNGGFLSSSYSNCLH